MNRRLSAIAAGMILLSSAGVQGAASAQWVTNHQTSFDRSVMLPGLVVPRGTRITVQHEDDQILIGPAESKRLTLTVQDAVVINNRFLIGAGAQIEGALQPAPNGTRFVARTITLRNGDRYRIDAQSAIVNRQQTVQRNPRLGSVLTNAGIGAAAAAIVAGLTGDRRIDAIEVLGGAALGGASSFALNRQNTEAIAINPSEDLTLVLRSDLVLR